MKITKIKFNPIEVKSNPINSFEQCAKRVLNSVQQKRPVDKSSFSYGLYCIGDSFQAAGDTFGFNKKASWLAETLVGLKSNDLAGVVYSLLVKLNYGNPKLREKYATNALAIAVRTKDPVHIMARANDLKEIYKLTERGSDKHLKVMYQEKRALNEIVTNYDKIALEHNTITRELGSKDGYQAKLAAIKVEIGDLLKYKDPVLAKKELIEAREMYSVLGEGRNTEKIKQILEKIK